ncbi:cation transporter [Ideonella sp. BN130291]|uniref:cation transporter n=1 Tax=Ideonella sp. BN130291 TaxID=3112940 RepID=UPI002E26BBF2|nr:cation transporter [Ideonella sp. BN130291]
MSAHCCHHEAPPSRANDPRYRRVLWIALLLNAAMFLLEVGAGVRSGSVSLLADAVDFAGDAANYGLSLAVLAMGVVARARAAQVKAASMGAFGVLVLGRAIWAWTSGQVPEPATMGVVAVLALAVNVGVAVLLYAWREGDANMRSVWLCTRNDALGNVAVGLAALGVFGTGSAWPDLLVAAAMALLALSASISVLRQAKSELATPHTHAQHPH